MTDPRTPVVGGGVGRDLRRLLAVVALVRHEVLDDDLLQVAELGVHGGQRVERGKTIITALADADQNPAGERDPQLAGRPDRVQALGRMLGRGALVRDQIGVHRLKHQALRGGHLA